MKTAFIYSEKFGAFYYGADHPMRPFRLLLTYELMEASGLTRLPGMEIIQAREATEKELLLFHTGDYLKILKEANTGIIPVGAAPHGLGFGDNPVFAGCFEWSSYSTGASMQAAELVGSGEVDVAFNICGGLHHAMPKRASGFCYLNDAAVAIKHLVSQGKRVAYVDIDAHHGDGVEYGFYESDRVLTVSLHESGQYLFPGTGSVTDCGLKQGTGYSVNLPLPPGTGDTEYYDAFMLVVPDFISAFAPDVLVTQLGVDSFSTDPITHMNLTTNGFEKVVREFRGMGYPWIALGGGGYNLGNVARGWALAWAVMNGAVVPEKIPGEFIEKNGEYFASDSFRDPPESTESYLREGDKKEIDREIAFLKEKVLPLVSGKD
jgi:acetoin utilization protein AcuC